MLKYNVQALALNLSISISCHFLISFSLHFFLNIVLFTPFYLIDHFSFLLLFDWMLHQDILNFIYFIGNLTIQPGHNHSNPDMCFILTCKYIYFDSNIEVYLFSRKILVLHLFKYNACAYLRSIVI